MTRVERQVIKRSHPLWGVIDDMCFKAKNLYNYANYILRQEFIQNNNYISYRQMNKELKTHEEYKECMSQPANCILRLLDKNWKSYFQAIKQYSKYPNKFLGKPNIPNYKKKNGRCNWIIPNNSCYYDNGELKFRIRKLQSIKWKCGCKGRLIQVRFVPNGSIYTMEIVYQIDNEPCLNDEPHRIMGIDLGVNNLVTASNNIGEPPFIINGRGLKSINQFYNKRKSKLQSGLPKEQFWSKQLDNLTFKRYCRIKNYMHHTSRKIIDWMRKHNIDTLVVGHNKNKLSTRFIREYDVISLEDLNVSGILKNHKLARSVSDVSWSQFVTMLQYKADWYGKEIVKIDRFFASSQLCSVCGYKNTETKDLSVRSWVCPNCGTSHDRDVNASINILNEGLKQIV